MEKTYEEHFSNDIKTKNKIQSIRKSIKSSEKSATATMAATPIIASNAIQGIENMCKSNTNGNETSMALVKPMPDVSLQEPFSSAISTCTKLIKKGDIVYKEEVTTTTNVITTTTTKTKFTIIKQNADDQDECNTPKKGKKIPYNIITLFLLKLNSCPFKKGNNISTKFRYCFSFFSQ